MKAMALGVIAGATLLLGVGSASAQVNCAQVMRNLKTGRSPEQVAETMVIDVSEVKKCQEAAEKAAPATPAAAEKKE
jgi:hypothetical protein